MKSRKCGECNLCCKLLPVKEIAKGHNERCAHQRFKKGCAIYANRPRSCQVWSCEWLFGKDTENLLRPDITHYVIDPSPDYVTVSNDKDGTEEKVPVIQIWVDPKYPTAHRDQKIREYLLKKAEQRILGLFRYSPDRVITVIPPTLNKEQKWLEIMSVRGEKHTTEDLIDVFGKQAVFDYCMPYMSSI